MIKDRRGTAIRLLLFSPSAELNGSNKNADRIWSWDLLNIRLLPKKLEDNKIQSRRSKGPAGNVENFASFKNRQQHGWFGSETHAGFFFISSIHLTSGLFADCAIQFLAIISLRKVCRLHVTEHVSVVFRLLSDLSVSEKEKKSLKALFYDFCH